MSSEGLSPFEILGISPDAELIVVQAAYKALARKYHPDANPGVPAEELHRKMSDINWAKDELERDLEGWKKLADNSGLSGKEAPSRGEAGRASPIMSSGPRVMVEVEPQVLNLAGRRGSAAVFLARAGGVQGAEIRARFEVGCIEVERLGSDSGLATFKVIVTEDFTSDIDDTGIETVEVNAPGFVSAKVFATVAPLSRRILEQQYGARVAPPRHVSATARISFGKHRGSTFQEIAVGEPGYLRWMLREGAGSRIERDSAKMALGELDGSTWLPPSPKRKRRQVRARPSSRQSLPDPHRPGGLLGAIRSLILRDRS